tara:strand:- start:336 stop:1037 length:702 start_codon:yes stop_codon:yes gene_type:complete
MSFGGGGGGTQSTQVTPYAPAQPALNQILSESGNLYNQGVAASGYVAPTEQTLTGLAQQEVMGTAAQNELAATLGGQYLNPFLSPLIQKAGSDIYGSVASQFSGAGRTPGSPLMQNQVASQVAQAALPMAFNTYENERARQLGVASQAPSVLQTGQQLESLQRQQQMAPFQSLQQYAGLVSPIASGFPVQSGSTNTQTNPLTSAAGGALLGSQFGGPYGALIGGGLGLLGGLL